MIPLKAKYTIKGGAQYKSQKSSTRGNPSTSVHKGNRWQTVRAAARRGTGY